MIACVPLYSLLGDEGIAGGCEGDVLTSVTMLMLHYLTGGTVTYGDLLDLHEGVALLSSCGMSPFSLADEGGATVCNIGYPGFSGVISSMSLRPGTVTFARLAEGRGDYTLNYGLGEGLPSRPRQGRFPALSVRLAGDGAALLDSLASQHLALAYGDTSAPLETLARLLGITVRRV